MTRNIDHSLLHKAKVNKRDEFYTLRADIERELQYYSKHFRNRIIFCNCDDVRSSNFFNYFVDKFHFLEITKLICSCKKQSDSNIMLYQNPEIRGFYYEYTGIEKRNPDINDVAFFKGDGDFRSKECVDLLKQSDIVVTNPPFSLFREFVGQLIKYNKKFIIIGNINAITYKEIFNLIKDNRIWLGVNLGRGISGFKVPQYYDLYGLETKVDNLGNKIVSPNNCLWLTNLDNSKRHDKIILTKRYRGHEKEYPHYDNYDGINVNRTKDIPSDYDGVMGVPITFLHKFNPTQFEIIKFRKGNDNKDLTINGKPTYFRILIKRK